MTSYYYKFLRWTAMLLTLLQCNPSQLVEYLINTAREKYGDTIVNAIKGVLPFGSIVVGIVLVWLVLRNKAKDLDRGGCGEGGLSFLKWTLVVLLAVLAVFVVVHRARTLDQDAWDSGGLAHDLKEQGLTTNQRALEQDLTTHVPVELPRKPITLATQNYAFGSDADDEDIQEPGGHTFDTKCKLCDQCGSSDQIGKGVGLIQWMGRLNVYMKCKLISPSACPFVVPEWLRQQVVRAVPYFTVYELSHALVYLIFLAIFLSQRGLQETPHLVEIPVISLDLERSRTRRQQGSRDVIERFCCQQAQSLRRDCVPDLPYSSRPVVASVLNIKPAEEIGAVEGTRPRDDTISQEADQAQIREDTERMEEENERLRHQLNCLLCTTKLRTILFIPCGHMVCCQECASRVPKCPICREKINRRWLVYIPDG